MDLQLSGKTAIVTGATAGIGLAIATTLAREGVSVTITGRGGDKLDAAVQRIAAAAPGSQVTAVVADQSGAEGAARLTDEDWLRMIDVNVMSGVRLSRHYFPRMLQKN
jgi:3-oxoacyl-[acyl-carrier protein] reductase